MSNIEAPTPIGEPNIESKLIESKKYEIKFKEDAYNLLNTHI